MSELHISDFDTQAREALSEPLRAHIKNMAKELHDAKLCKVCSFNIMLGHMIRWSSVHMGISDGEILKALEHAMQSVIMTSDAVKVYETADAIVVEVNMEHKNQRPN